MKRTLRNITIWMVILLALILTRITVASGSQGNAAISDEARHELEMTIVSEIKNTMKENYISNCGVTLNKVIYDDNRCDYSIVVHHSTIGKLADDDTDRVIYEINDCIGNILGEDNICDLQSIKSSDDTIIISYVN